MMENMKGYYAQDCGPASHNQAMIADENDDKGRTVAVVYDREKARAIVKACNEYEEMRGVLENLLSDVRALATRSEVNVEPVHIESWFSVLKAKKMLQA